MVINDHTRKSKQLAWKHFLVLVNLVLFCACQSGPRFAPLDLSASGWHTSNGQAIWKPDHAKPEIVGDLLVSHDQNGNAYLQFSKAFPIVSARLSRDGWQTEFPPQNKIYAAPGKPPARIVWLQFLREITGNEVNPRWQVQRNESSTTFTNPSSGEFLELHLDPSPPKP